MRRVVAVAAAVLAIAGCGGGSSSEGEPAEAAPPMVAVSIVATDFAFEMREASIPAGVVETTLVNEGREPHQAGYYRLNDGVTFEDFVASVVKDDSTIPQLAEGGRSGYMRSLAPGETGVRPGDELEPGEYAVLCSIRDPETGKNHYELGMVARLTVQSG